MTCRWRSMTPFAVPEGGQAVIDVGTRQGHNFSAERAEPNANVFDARDQACACAAGARTSAS